MRSRGDRGEDGGGAERSSSAHYGAAASILMLAPCGLILRVHKGSRKYFREPLYAPQELVRMAPTLKSKAAAP